MKFSGQSRASLSSWSKNVLREQARETGLGILHDYEVAGVKVPRHGLNFLPAPKEETLGLQYQLARYGAEKEKGRPRLKICPRNSKNGSQTLYHACLLEGMKLERKQGNLCMFNGG